ncbi:MAG: DUF1080 domain-containing protein [Planctomycetaceae bacterium]|nr:DUF1080 domain-containing protein [Planctomycetaceae bacterium]
MRTFLAIIAVGLLFSAGAHPSRADEPQAWQSLFNGKDLSGWKYDESYWSVQDGVITGQTTPDHLLKGYNTFCVLADKQPADFQLRLKYRIVGGNSGVQYRSKVLDDQKWIVGGYQADIDSTPTYSGINYHERGRGILADRGQSVEIAASGAKRVTQFADKEHLQELAVKPEQWNDYLIVARGNHLQHFINGVLTAEVIDDQPDHAASSGVIALQAHAGPPMIVQFKEIELLELQPEPAE